MSELSIILVSWNSSRFLDRCLGKLLAQTGSRAEVILIDNGSEDDSIDRFLTRCPQGLAVRNPSNLGYAEANNQGIRASQGNLVLFLNTDCFLDPGYLSVLRKRLETHPELAGVQGMYLREDDPLLVDSMGLLVRRSGVAKDLGAGAPPPPNPDFRVVDGLCCAAALFRREALETIRRGDDYFDRDFGSYYEDVDLALRLRNAGWTVACDPNATARHVRGGSQRDPAAMHRLALRNKYFTLIKNTTSLDLARRLPFVLGWEALKAPYFLLTSPRVLAGYLDVMRDFRLFWEKKKRG